jgi:hypothetical protein
LPDIDYKQPQVQCLQSGVAWGSDVQPFHRKANRKTQSLRIAIQQNKSRELWGRGAFGGLPAVVAWLGGLPEPEQGTGFATEVPFAKNGDPAWAYWYMPQHGGDPRVSARVQAGEDFACISIEPVQHRYRCRNQR